MLPPLAALVAKPGGNSVLRAAAERALLYATGARQLAGDARAADAFAATLAALPPDTAAFLGDYARKVLAKAEPDSDEEDDDAWPE